MKTATIQLSDAAIKRHFLDPNIKELRDTRYPLRLRFNTARTKGSWFVVKYTGGKAIWRKVGSWPNLGTRLMIDRMPKILAIMDDAPDLAAMASYEIVTVAELCSWYAERMNGDRSITESRKAGVRSAIKHRIMPLIGDAQVCELSPSVIDERFLMPLQARYAVGTVNATWLVLKRMTKLAHSLNLIESNPLAAARFVDHIQAKIKPKAAKLKPSQARDVYQVLLAQQKHTGAMLAMLMLLHGTRIGETRRARWEQFDLEAGHWTIPAENTKTRQEHRLPLTETAKQKLVMFGYAPKRTGYLFPSVDRRKPLSATAANEWVQYVSGREWTSHDLRKMARSCWMDLGTDYMVCEFMLNHALNKLDKTYIHTHAEAQIKIALNSYHEYLQCKKNRL